MLFSTATTLTFGRMKIHTLVKKHDFSDVFHKYVGQYRKWPLSWTLCFIKQTKRGTVPRVLKQCVGRAAKCGSTSRWKKSHEILAGAPPHFIRPVTEWLNNHFPNQCQWVGKNDPVAWPPLSADFNPCDFCPWRWMKQLVTKNRSFSGPLFVSTTSKVSHWPLTMNGYMHERVCVIFTLYCIKFLPSS